MANTFQPYDPNAGSSPVKGRFHDRGVKIIAEQLGMPVADVTSEKNFIKDLGADSLDTIELIMALEDEFSIEISDDDAEKIETVQQALDYVNTCERAR